MPLNAFVIRPFGAKQILVPSASAAAPRMDEGSGQASPALARVETVDGTVQRITLDFDAVHRDLIEPALTRLRIRGETAEAVVTAGNIREDMFHRLLTADLVIADVSLHNANVFYELGIRQAFRDKYTFLIRCDLSAYPFDLSTDRYFEYSATDPAQSVERLADALRATLSSSKADSPVFKLIPRLEAEDRSHFIVVPDEFREEVERAQKYYRPGDLRLLAMEAQGYLWEVEGLRAVGRAQFELNYIDGARLTWEQIVDRYPDDVEANAALSTIYQRLNDTARSEQALARVSRTGMLSANRLSQVRGLQARNLKARWVGSWRVPGSEGRQWQEAALRSPLLQRACDAYEEAFKADLNNAYAGLNALSLLITQTDLAVRHPELWASLQQHRSDAERAIAQNIARVKALMAAVQLAVEAERDRLQCTSAFDCWFKIVEAAVECIVSEQPERVVQMYQDALLWTPGDAVRSMRQALQVYKDLDVGECAWGREVGIGTMKVNTDRAISVLQEEQERQRSDRPDRIILFVGLRVDPQDCCSAARAARGSGRFPAHAVEAARAAIREAVEAERKHVLDQGGKILCGMAGGAAGSDILFHQVCEDLEIETSMYLAVPWEHYLGEYVAPGGPDWVEQFLHLYRRRKPNETNGAGPRQSGYQAAHMHVLADSKELPRWLQGKPYYNIGRRTNIWMLQHALVRSFMHDNASVTLIVLSDHAAHDGSGWFSNVMALAGRHGIKVRRIDRDRWLDRQPADPNGETPAPASFPAA